MGLLDPLPTPYDPIAWSRLPLPERSRLVCQAWALQGYGTPLGVYAAYGLKVLLYVGGWVAFCATSPSLGPVGTVGGWWLEPLAFQKAILWSMLFEGVGLGCGSGPLTGRYLPPVGGFLYWLRPGTTKLSLLEGVPGVGGRTRTWLDVLLYAAFLVLSLRALTAPTLGPAELWPLAVLPPVLGLLDKTLFLALRAEHYWVTIVGFVAVDDWIPAAMAVQLALWFWAGFSKLNAHFPAVICVMTSNSPFGRSGWLRRRMYVRYPDDLRPSRLAHVLAHLGTALELGVPILFVASMATGRHEVLVGAMAAMLVLHVYITSNVPMGVPIEWNVMVVYGAFALFWAHPDVTVLDLRSPLLGAFLAVMLVGLPLLGNFFPERLSFLFSMRYYAGNWAYSVWLFSGGSHRKLDRLTKSAAWIPDQLSRFYDPATATGLIGKVMAFRMMHLHGRALAELIPKAVDRFEDVEYVDGELVAGLALGWNFGDGHLHHERLLRNLTAQCGFAAGEVRCIFVESQPAGRARLGYRIVDAVDGVLEAGSIPVRRLLAQQPWGTG
ncbi:MAG: DUF3556 domain-containing protein [Sandaracinaceae bacterium]